LKEKASATVFVASQSIGNQRLEGIRFSEIETDSRYYGVINGVVVTEIDQASLAWQRGLRQGDIITKNCQRKYCCVSSAALN